MSTEDGQPTKVVAAPTPDAAPTRDDDGLADLTDRIRLGPDAPYGWWPVVLLTLVTLVDRIETSLVAGVLPLLQDEWGFGDTLGGAIPTAAAVAGIIFTLPAGYLADRQDRRWLIAVVVALWSVITLGSALALGFAMFFVTRVVLGAADSIHTPVASSLIADYHPPSTRARAYGLHRMVYFAGSAVGVLLGGLIGELVGWRAAFLAVIVPGALVAVAVYRLPEPPRGGIDRLLQNRDGGTGIDAAAGLPGGLAAFRSQMGEVLVVATLRRLLAGLVTLFVGMAGIVYWLPTYFDRIHGTGTAKGGALTAAAGLVGLVGGAALGGFVGDRRHRVRPSDRVLLGGAGLTAGSVVLGLALLDLPLAARVPLFTLSVLLVGTSIPNLTAALADVMPAGLRGTGFALVQFFLAAGAAGGPLAVGVASDVAGSLTLAYAVLIVPMVVGSLLVLRARTTFEDDARAGLDTSRI